MMTKEQFLALKPMQRGYYTYMLGCRDDEPNVPDEANPYRPDTEEYYQWMSGRDQAITVVVDIEG